MALGDATEVLPKRRDAGDDILASGMAYVPQQLVQKDQGNALELTEGSG